MAVKNGGMRMAEERSVTGRSADVVVGQVVGLSGRSAITEYTTAMLRRPATHFGISLNCSSRLPWKYTIHPEADVACR